MFNILDIFLVLALISTIATTSWSQQAVGPEGYVGSWIMPALSCILLAIPVFNLATKRSLGFIPVGYFMEILIAVGIIIAFGTTLFGVYARGYQVIRGLVMIAPYLILIGVAWKVHHSDLPDLKAIHKAVFILLNGTAVLGWGLAFTGMVLYMKANLERSAEQMQKERDYEDERTRQDMVEYGKLSESAALSALLPYTWSRNMEVKQLARKRVNMLQGLDDQLIELLDKGFDDAITYIASVYEDPPAKLSPAWGRMLKRQLKRWNSLQYDQNAGSWEYNIRPYFTGAQKLINAGGDLHDELALWHTHLQKCKGLGSLAKYVEKML